MRAQVWHGIVRGDATGDDDIADLTPFDAPEYDRRLALVTRAMAAGGLDALFISDPSNMAWLTGYDGWSFYVPQGVIVLPDAPPFWWGRAMDGNGAARTIWMPEDRILRYDDGFVQSTERHPMSDLARHLSDLGLTRARIGVELDNYYYSAKSHLTLCRDLPQATLADATGLVNWQRCVKSEPELAFMSKAAGISERIIDGLLERARPGVPKNEVVAEAYRDAIAGGPDWGDYPAIVPMLPSGQDASAPHLTWDGRPFRSGEATFFEISGCFRRYHAPLCRTVYLGDPPPALRKAEEALVQGIEAGLSAARAGNTAGDIAQACMGELRRAGIERTGRMGYPVGLSYPPDWGERTISIREEDTSVLKPGMTFHFMPGLWTDDWGLEITETILVETEGPARTLCNRPRQLFVRHQSP